MWANSGNNDQQTRASDLAVIRRRLTAPFALGRGETHLFPGLADEVFAGVVTIATITQYLGNAPDVLLSGSFYHFVVEVVPRKQ